MLEAIRNLTQGWIAKVILAVITVPFALFGIDQYFNNAGGNVAVASIDGDEISVQEFGRSLESVRNRLQAQGQKVDQALLDSPELKQSVLDGLITRRLVAQEVQDAKFSISDNQLNQHILGMQEFQENGKFSQEIYAKTLQQNKLSASKLEASIRQDLLMEQARDSVAKLAFVPTALSNNALNIAFQQREVSVFDIKAKDYLEQASVTDEAIKAYYEKHQDKLKVPEQVKVEFALLSAASLIRQVEVTDEEVNEFYQSNLDQFQGDEQRQASHILIGFGDDKEVARLKAEGLLAQIQADPSRFEELAVKNSEDTGSAQNGGDLGSFGRGAMVKPFEDAVFSMEVDQVSDLVESEFGYHIIKLTGVSGEAPELDMVKAQIKADLIFQKAQIKYAEQTEEFSNVVYEQSGSLKPVAEQFDIKLQTSEWLSQADVAKFFKSDKLSRMVFSQEVLKEKRNTEAVEVSANNLVAARVVEYKAETPRTFDEVKESVANLLKAEQAVKLATEKGEADLAKLNANERLKLDWTPEVIVDRKNAQGLTNGVMQQVFKLNTDTLPAYTGFYDETTKAYTIVKLIGVTSQLDDESVKQSALAQYETAVGAEYVSAYAGSLKAKKEIEINASVLAPQEQ